MGREEFLAKIQEVQCSHVHQEELLMKHIVKCIMPAPDYITVFTTRVQQSVRMTFVFTNWIIFAVVLGGVTVLIAILIVLATIQFYVPAVVHWNRIVTIVISVIISLSLIMYFRCCTFLLHGQRDKIYTPPLMSILSAIEFGPTFNYAIIENGVIVDFCDEARPSAVQLETISESELRDRREREHTRLIACRTPAEENTIFEEVDILNNRAFRQLQPLLSIEHFQTYGIVRCVGVVVHVGPYTECEDHIDKEYYDLFTLSPVSRDVMIDLQPVLFNTTGFPTRQNPDLSLMGPIDGRFTRTPCRVEYGIGPPVMIWVFLDVVIRSMVLG